MKNSFVLSIVIFSLALVLLPASTALAATYTTAFPLTETPLSEGGKWVNGKTNGTKWADVKTTTNFAFGTQTGADHYADSTAILTGTWGPNQTVQATVYTKNQSSNIFEEVELRLRSTISSGSNTGYEINFSARSANPYCQIVRWNGALGSWTLINATSSGVAIRTGDIIKATISGSTITVYLNGVKVLQATDSTYTTGNPGIGFYLEGGSSVNNTDHGFTSFTASDGIDSKTPSPPTLSTSP